MIYLDHAAATPVSEKVLKAMEPYFSHEFFNPSAAYLPAKKVAADYENAKAVIAHAIGAKAHDLVITAGATEANNLAFSCIDIKPVLSSAGLEFSSTSYAGTPREPSLRDEPLGSVRNIRVENSNQNFTLSQKKIPAPSTTTTTTATTAKTTFDWGEFTKKVQSLSDAVYSQLIKTEHEFAGGVLHIYPLKKIVKSILARDNNKRILVEAAGGVKITIHDFDDTPSDAVKDETLAKISAIMGGEVQNDGGGNPFK